MGNNGIEPHHIEVTSSGGASKWIRNIISHTVEEIKEALNNNDVINFVDNEGGEATVDMNRVFMIRFQDDKVFRKRSKNIKVANERRRS